MDVAIRRMTPLRQPFSKCSTLSILSLSCYIHVDIVISTSANVKVNNTMSLIFKGDILSKGLNGEKGYKDRQIRY